EETLKGLASQLGQRARRNTPDSRSGVPAPGLDRAVRQVGLERVEDVDDVLPAGRVDSDGDVLAGNEGRVLEVLVRQVGGDDPGGLLAGGGGVLAGFLGVLLNRADPAGPLADVQLPFADLEPGGGDVPQ